MPKDHRHFVRLASHHFADRPDSTDSDVLVVWIRCNGQAYVYRFRPSQALDVIRLLHRDVAEDKYPLCVATKSTREIHNIVGEWHKRRTQR